MVGPLFPLGAVVATPGALGLLEEHGAEPGELLSRHRGGDWGEITPDDWAMNDRDLLEGGRLFSAYDLLPPQAAKSARDPRVWVITEADRSVTALLVPEDY